MQQHHRCEHFLLRELDPQPEKVGDEARVIGRRLCSMRVLDGKAVPYPLGGQIVRVESIEGNICRTVIL